MSGMVGDARKRALEDLAAFDERADILAELAETQAALHAATNDVVRLAAELHTAHGQVDRVRQVVETSPAVLLDGGYIDVFIPADNIRAALDVGAS